MVPPTFEVASVAVATFEVAFFDAVIPQVAFFKVVPFDSALLFNDFFEDASFDSASFEVAPTRLPLTRLCHSTLLGLHVAFSDPYVQSMSRSLADVLLASGV